MSPGAGSSTLREERLYRLDEVARLIRLNEKTVRERYLKSGELKGFKIGHKWLVREQDLAAFLEKHRFTQSDEAA